MPSRDPSPSASLSHVVVLTGPGGSGLSTALRALEDAGFYCIDNLPVVLLDKFLELIHSKHDITRVALVIDVRDKHFLDDAPETLAHAIEAGIPLELVFLDADDDVLVRRYSETRRRHALSARSVRDGIQEERRRLQRLRELAHTTIETSHLTGNELRAVITGRYGSADRVQLALNVLSFGYKHGIPAEADLVLDVRFLPNPYYNAELRPLRGTDEPVRSYVLGLDESQRFIDLVDDLLGFLLPLYAREGKRYLTLAIGCTGGHHRSVALAEAIRDRLERLGHSPRVRHRDIAR